MVHSVLLEVRVEGDGGSFDSLSAFLACHVVGASDQIDHLEPLLVFFP